MTTTAYINGDKSHPSSPIRRLDQPRRPTWHRSEEQEEAMERRHGVFWRCILDALPPADIVEKDVLDFGCNRGGFDGLLHERYLPRSILGVDVAYGSIQFARSRYPDSPIKFELTDYLEGLRQTFDTALSLEVLYLLPDLDAHAKQMFKVLKTAGRYYIALGCHTSNPFWAEWKTSITQDTGWPAYSYSPEDIVCAFQQVGFSAAVRRVPCDHFIPVREIEPASKWKPAVSSLLNYYEESLLLFQFTKIA